MPVAAWIAIGVTATGIVWAVMWWAFRRQIARLDAVEHHLHEPDGCLRLAIAKCVSEEDLDLNLAPLTRQLDRIAEEGRDRERRMTDAISDSQRTLRTDITGIHQRIDRVWEQNAKKNGQ